MNPDVKIVITVDIRFRRGIREQHITTLEADKFSLKLLRQYCSGVRKMYNLIIYDGNKVVRRSNYWSGSNNIEQTYDFILGCIEKLNVH